MLVWLQFWKNFHFYHFKITVRRDHTNISVVQKEQSHPIWEERLLGRTWHVSLAQNDENQFLNWTWKPCFTGINNNSRAIEIKKILGHLLEEVFSFIKVEFWSCCFNSVSCRFSSVR